ncbi:MAG: hypothetical protein H5T60_08910, partial [Anaerolineae bacterium]|nr:hypothetical protein [Anaerolineae bacterium]
MVYHPWSIVHPAFAGQRPIVVSLHWQEVQAMSTADEAWRKFLRAVREGALFARGDTVVAG